MINIIRAVLLIALVALLGYMGYFITNSWEWWIIMLLTAAIGINEKGEK